MKKNPKEKELLRQIHSGMRLKTKAPKRETPGTVYNRKKKHKGRHDASLYYFLGYFLKKKFFKNLLFDPQVTTLYYTGKIS